MQAKKRYGPLSADHAMGDGSEKASCEGWITISKILESTR